MTNSLDARERPPESIKELYKRYQKLTLEAIRSDPTILDFRRGLSGEQQCKVRRVSSVPRSSMDAACSHLRHPEARKAVAPNVVPVYEIEAVPGEL